MRGSALLVAEVGAGHVAIGGFVRAADGRLEWRHREVATFEAGPAGEADWEAEVAHALRTLANRIPSVGAVTLAVPSHVTLTKFVRTPAVAKSKRGMILQFEAAQNIPYPLDEVVWDHAIVGEDGADLELVLAAAKTEAMTALCAVADAAGFSVVRVVPVGLALRDAFRINYPETAESVLLVDVGARSSTLLSIERERFSLRTVAGAGHAVTVAIAEELKLEFPAAEVLKCDVSSDRWSGPKDSPQSAAVRRAADQFSEHLWLEIKRTMANLQRQTAFAAPTMIYLTGGGSLLIGLAATLAERSTLRTERYDPFRRMSVPPNKAAIKEPENAARLAGLVGLAVSLEAKSATASISLLPTGRRAELAARYCRPRWLAAAGLTMVALLPPIRHYHALAAAIRARVTESEREFAPLRAARQRTAALLEQISVVQRTVNDLRAGMAEKTAWRDFFHDLQGRLVEVGDSWIDRIVLVPATETGAAGIPHRRLALSGRLLDRGPAPTDRPDSRQRMNSLRESLAQSPFVVAVENERYDAGRVGLLRFDLTLVVDFTRKP